MKEGRTVQKIFNVFEGEFRPGFIKRMKNRPSAALVYYLSGRADYLFKDYTLKVDEGKFFYLSKDAFYDIKVYEPSKFVCIDFDFEGEVMEKSEAYKSGAAAVKNEFEKIVKLWTEKNLWVQSDAFSIVYKLYSKAIESSHEKYVKSNEKFYPVLEYLLNGYTRSDFTVKELADFAGVCEVQLRRMFKNAVKTSPNRYINFLRLEKAKTLLKESNFTVEEIAYSVGIEDAYYFSRLFKKLLGLSPTAFRKSK